ncbi:MAG: PqiC family protein [Desulfuromonadales bacterium]|nr:PqiC family protein [Desulfuromonadales bacterium]
MKQRATLIGLGSLLLLTLLSACSGPKTQEIRYYSLLSTTPQDKAPAVEEFESRVGVGPVSLPQLLKRPHLVTRSGKFRVLHAEFDRWSGDLQEEVGQVLADNLAGEFGADNVVLFPWGKLFAPEWQLTVEIFRLDGELDDAAYLDARWSLANERKKVALSGAAQSREELAEPSYAALVEALNRLLEDFSREIAEKIHHHN